MKHSSGIRRQRGLSLVELMVGAAIGLLGTVVIMQMAAFAEGHKRSTTSGSDAQVNGAIALYTLQRDLAMAGYGLVPNLGGLGCPIKAKFGSNSFTWNLAPVTITAGTAGMPDQITLLGSSKSIYAVPTRVVVDHPPTAANFFVDSTLGVAEGDLMVAVPATIDANNWCSVLQVTRDTSGGSGTGNGGGQGQNQVLHNSGNDGPWNQPGGQTIFPSSGYRVGSYLLNLGQMRNRTYSITNDFTLRQTDFNTTTATAVNNDLLPQIVNLKAFYGKDTNNDQVVDTYDVTTPTNAAGWAQLRTVRLALVARSAQFEKDEVTSAGPQWEVGSEPAVAGSATCASGSGQCIALKVDHIPDWKHYRYKVFEVVVPLRNMLWSS